MPRNCSQTVLGWNAIGTHIQMYDTSVSPAVYRPIAKIDDVTGPQGKTSVIDVTTHDTTNGTVQKVANLSDSGQVTMSAVWDPTDATHNELNFYGLLQAYNDKQIRTWRIVYPTSPSMEINFCGFVAMYQPSAKAKDVLRASFSIEVTGGFDLELTSAD